MKSLFILFFILSTQLGAVEIREALIGEPDAAAMATAAARLENYKLGATEKNGENSAREKRLMRVLYWTPADREPQPQYRARLTRVLTHIQNFYAREMARNGLGEKTIQLDFAADGLLNLPLVKGTRLDKDCAEADPATRVEIRNDCLRELKKLGIDGEHESLVIFCNLADWDAEKRIISHHSPYCAGGSPRGGTAWQVDSPLLDSEMLGEKGQFLHDRQYGEISLGKYNSIFIGGACHEIGHLLGLSHCNEPRGANEKFGTALMGSGNQTYGEELRGESKGSYLTRANALKLATHPQFSGTTRQMTENFTATFSDLTFTSTDDALKISGKVTAELPLLSVSAYADPAGNADYNCTLGAGIVGADGSFTVDVPQPKLKFSVTVKLFLVPIGFNGAATAYSGVYGAFSLPTMTDKTGKLVAQNLQTYAALMSPPCAAPNELAQKIQARLALPDNAENKLSPLAIAADLKKLSLSDAKPTSVQTRLGGAHFDRLPENQPLVTEFGVYSQGLFAPAPSTYRYQLDGKWKKFSGDCGLALGKNGALKFMILGDDKLLWESPKIGGKSPSYFEPSVSADQSPLQFAVDVSEVKELILQTAPVGDNERNAWGLWLVPTLTR